MIAPLEIPSTLIGLHQAPFNEGPCVNTLVFNPGMLVAMRDVYSSLGQCKDQDEPTPCQQGSSILGSNDTMKRLGWIPVVPLISVHHPPPTPMIHFLYSFYPMAINHVIM